MTLSVKASGMVTAVGFNAPASLAAMRAGISGVRTVNLWDTESGEYISGAKVDLPQWWEGLGKLAELAAPAIHECLLAAKPVPAEEIPIMLGVASPDRPYRLPGLDEQLLNEVEYRLNLKHHPLSRLIPRGNVSGVVAIQEAYKLIGSGEIPCCIIAGVDSFLQQNVVEAYISKRRVLTPLNSNGFIPGEAACAVLLTLSIHKHDGALHIVSWGQGREIGTINSDTPLTGDGLTNALREALSHAGINMADTDYWLTDQNAEHYKAKECTIAQIRLERRSKPAPFPYEIWHPIEYLGEIGSAVVPCLLGVCFAAAEKEYSPGPLALLSLGEDNGERAALVLKWEAAK